MLGMSYLPLDVYFLQEALGIKKENISTEHSLIT